MKSKIQFKAGKMTMGDLIVAITDAALEVVQDEDMAYRIAGLVFVRLLAVSDAAPVLRFARVLAQ